MTGRDPGDLFLSREGRALEPKRLSEKVRGYVEAAGTTKAGLCHLLRHTAGTLMPEGSHDVRFIQAMLGQESLETTQIYTRVQRPSSPRTTPPRISAAASCAIAPCPMPCLKPRGRRGIRPESRCAGYAFRRALYDSEAANGG
ncbi:MAG TPA: tyrosine-type recombinase/integrase [Sphingobium sp.]|uniref:tyrosine-type recombinase/integrase n=1 Tax=Sphingobium sp. TaxID=1912891 RepID=UPI002ED42311